MAQINTLLELRNKIKERKPEFIRQDNPKRMKLNDKWRKPKGIHSKIRHKFKGHRKMPSPGYKSPKKIKGMHASGLKIINVSSPQHLQNISKENEGIVVAKNVGMKKRLDILMKAKESNINVLNVNIDEHIKKIQDFINSKKKVTEKEKKKEAKPVESKEKKELKEDTDVKMSDENRKEAEKKEKDKLLTKKI